MDLGGQIYRAYFCKRFTKEQHTTNNVLQGLPVWSNIELVILGIQKAPKWENQNGNEAVASKCLAISVVCISPSWNPNPLSWTRAPILLLCFKFILPKSGRLLVESLLIVVQD